MDWFGHQFLTAGPVVYIAGEGVSGIKKRVKRWCEYHSLAYPPPAFHVIPMPYDFLKATEIEILIKQIAPLNPVKVTVDTVAANMRGSDSKDENMALLLNGAGQLRHATGATVNLIHHCGYDTTHARGWSGFGCALDTEISVKRRGDKITDGFLVKCEKLKEYEEFNPLVVQCKKVGVGDESSVVLTGIETDNRDRQIEDDKAVADVLKYLAAPMVQSELAKAAGLHHRHIKPILSYAETNGLVTVEQRGNKLVYSLGLLGHNLLARFTLSTVK